MKQIKLSSATVYLMAFHVVREWVSPFPCYRKDNYIVKYLQLTEHIKHNKMHGITVYSSVLLSSLGI